jgi:hypothetical protein
MRHPLASADDPAGRRRCAVGHDYADVPPTRGVFKGSAQEMLAVPVRLQAL